MRLTLMKSLNIDNPKQAGIPAPQPKHRFRQTISADPGHVFIISAEQGRICLASDAARDVCADDPVGQPLRDVLHLIQSERQQQPGYFNRRWVNVSHEPLSTSDESFTRVILKDRTDIPERSSLEAIRSMISTLLHRLRSPLTGIQGYLELIGADLDQTLNQRRFDGVQRELKQLFEILDDLERLYHMPSKPRKTSPSSTTAPESLIREFIRNCPVDTRQRLVLEPMVQPVSLQCNTERLERILSLLIENAVIFSKSATSKISIQFPSSNTIRISSHSAPISDKIVKRLFYPFVTTHADRLGIGLTKAHLLASMDDGATYLTGNSHDQGVSFTICYPPAQ